MVGVSEMDLVRTEETGTIGGKLYQRLRGSGANDSRTVTGLVVQNTQTK